MLTDTTREMIFNRYCWQERGEKTWEDVSNRVAKCLSKDDTDLQRAIFKSLMQTDFSFGGRVLRNAGRPKGAVAQCYNLPIGDSLEEIGDCYKYSSMLWGAGGGCGITFSTLRPKDAVIHTKGGISSGMMSWAKPMDVIAQAICSGGDRRAASLGLCEVWHPEILEFINAKLKEGTLKHFNLSVGINEAFIDAVRNDDKWDLHFNQQVYKTVKARKIWNLICKNMLRNGEPGLINMDYLRQNNSWYFAPITGTNPCGETCLEKYGICVLGSLVLPHYVRGSQINKSKLERDITTYITALDNCIDVNHYAVHDVKLVAQRGRRIGLGVMGLADMFFTLGIRYGSRRALDIIDNLFKHIRNCAYSASVRLASDKGSFPAFDSNLYCKTKFVRTLPQSLRKDIRRYGTRNVTMLAMAPTGSIAQIPNVVSGIEPLPFLAYKRRDGNGLSYYVHDIYADWLRNSNGDMPDYFVDSVGLTPTEHMETQAAIQRYTDGAVSKTIIVPKSFKIKDLSEVLLEGVSDVKGLTVYRTGSRKDEVITPLTAEEARQHLGVATTELAAEVLDCAKGGCEL